MTVERDIAGIVLPFAVGIMIGIVIMPYSLLTPFIPLFIMTSGIFLLSHPKHKDLSTKQLRIIIFSLLLCCGLLTALTDRILSISSIEKISSFFTFAGKFCDELTGLIEDIPFEDNRTGPLIISLITGRRETLDPATIETFRNSGASHILALSGLHLGILYGIIRFIFTWMGNTPVAQKIRSACIMLTCGFYTLATGASPSITRALIFILISETAVITGRQSKIGTTLMTALLIQLLLAPSSFRSIGFQLSYAAMAGIAFILPRLKRIWPDEDSGIMKKLWNSAAMSISCQITTAPLAYIHFGTFPHYFLITNLIAIPLTGLLIPANLIVMVLHSFGICPEILLKSAEWIVIILCDSLEVIASM